MKRLRRPVLSVIIVLGLSCLLAPRLSGQFGGLFLSYAPNLSLKQTHLGTLRSSLRLNNLYKNVFPSTVVSCPGAGTCTIRAEVSALLSAIDANEGVYAQVLVDGDQMSPGQVLIALDRNGNNSFSWMLPGVPSGLHTVDVQFLAYRDSRDPGERSVVVFDRVLKIDVYRP
jgi:hypothetical protein